MGKLPCLKEVCYRFSLHRSFPLYFKAFLCKIPGFVGFWRILKDLVGFPEFWWNFGEFPVFCGDFGGF